MAVVTPNPPPKTDEQQAVDLIVEDMALGMMQGPMVKFKHDPEAMKDDNDPENDDLSPPLPIPIQG